MSDTNDSFEKDLEQLIRLFKKIKDKSKAEHFSKLDPAFAQNLDFIINNYEMVKNNIPKEMFTQMGLPFRQLMREFISQLKNELGDKFEMDTEMETMVEDSIPQKQEFLNDIDEIDKKLKTPGLSEEQVNNLLDKRNALLNN